MLTVGELKTGETGTTCMHCGSKELACYGDVFWCPNCGTNCLADENGKYDPGAFAIPAMARTPCLRCAALVEALRALVCYCEGPVTIASFGGNLDRAKKAIATHGGGK